MNHMERMLAVLRHEKPDRAPVYPILAGVSRKLVGASYPEWSQNAEICARGLIETARQFDIDCVLSLIDLSVECDAWGQPIVFPENEAAHPDYRRCVIREIEDYEKIRKVDFRQSKRMMMHLDVVRRLAAELKGEMPIVAFVFGPMGTLSMLRSQQEMYMDLCDDIEAVKGATMRVAETLAEYAAALVDAGADAIMWDTLFASGSIMSKQMWREVEFEPMAMLSRAVREKGALNMIHNCGNRIYFDVQIEAMQPAAISFLYPPDDCADFAECKQKYGDKVVFIGCVPPTNVVVGTDEEWDAACREQLRVLGKDGGLVLATGCEYPANAPFDRARRMIEIAKTEGTY